MGIEQGTPVAGTIIDLPHNLDLLDDLRLPRVFAAWADFKTQHEQQIISLKTLQLREVVSLAKQLSISVSQAIGIETGANQNGINTDKINQLANSISGEGNRIIFMRHGEQSPPEWVFSIPQPPLRKIRMMQNPFNTEDLLTNKALVDVFLTAFSLLYVKQLTGKEVSILSSENLRAREVAEVISTIIPDAAFSIQEGLTSITYKDEKDQPPISLEDILADIPSGFMPWEPKLVDKLCKDTKKGIKQSEVIVQTMDGLASLGTKKEGNTLYVVLTHSQQLAEVLKFAGKLKDTSARFPELTMMVMNNPADVLILNEGVLGVEVFPRRKNMRRVLEKSGQGYEWYKIRRDEYKTDQQIPFLVSPEPFNISDDEGSEILRIGKDVVDFMYAADELYRSEEDVKFLLDSGKPRIFQDQRETRYLFARPDLIITDQGFSICEIETSPFGLSLAELLNRAYRSVGFDTMVGEGVLQKFMVNNTPSNGTIVYSDKNSSYAGQLQFLAREILSGRGREWIAEQADFVLGKDYSNVYRGFYQYEHLTDMFVRGLVETLLESSEITTIPSFTPHMEEKALLALIWDRRWESFLIKQLGGATINHLKEVIPPTWVIGQERFFEPGLPYGISSSEGLAVLSKSKRNFVLKKSGFSVGSSWAEGVSFLQEKSGERAMALLSSATRDTQSLYVVQEFKPSQERVMLYDKNGHRVEKMKARIRITPYFSMVGGDNGKLVAIKATGCEDTNYIHASTGSINTAVAVV